MYMAMHYPEILSRVKETMSPVNLNRIVQKKIKQSISRLEINMELLTSSALESCKV